MPNFGISNSSRGSRIGISVKMESSASEYFILSIAMFSFHSVSVSFPFQSIYSRPALRSCCTSVPKCARLSVVATKDNIIVWIVVCRLLCHMFPFPASPIYAIDVSDLQCQRSHLEYSRLRGRHLECNRAHWNTIGGAWSCLSMSNRHSAYTRLGGMIQIELGEDFKLSYWSLTEIYYD